MKNSMKALAKTKADVGIEMIEAEIPKIGSTDALIRVKKSAICGSDVHIYEWDEFSQSAVSVPMIVGHEFVGEIVEIGDAVSRFEVGQRVTAEGHLVCGKCRNCRAGRTVLCRNTRGIGFHRPGSFAEYVSIPEYNIIPIPDDIEDEIAAIFDPLGNAVHTALSFNCVGEDVLVTGAGPIGIMAAMIAQRAGARKVVITDINRKRLALAQKVGIRHAVDVTQSDIKEYMQQIGLCEGFDVGMEMSGAPEAMRDMLDVMNNGGKVALLGLPASDFAINWSQMIFKMLHLKGVYGREMFDSWYKMIALVQAGLDVSPLITHRISIDDYETGFAHMRSGEACKVVMSWD